MPCCRYLSSALFAVCLLATGAADAREEAPRTPALIGALPADSRTAYEGRCTRRSAAHKELLAKNRYVPPTLDVIRWRDAPKPPVKLLSEAALVAALKDGSIGVTLVEARGGLGKSYLVDSIEATICSEIAIFRLDLGRLAGHGVDRSGDSSDFFVRAMASWAGLQEIEDVMRVFRGALRQSRWLLMADALDEVPVSIRPFFIEGLRLLGARYASTGRVMVTARPSLGAPGHGFPAPSTHLVMSPLGCEFVAERVPLMLGDAATPESFWSRAATWELDRRSSWMGRCVFPNMATFRDLGAAIKVHKWDPGAKGFGAGSAKATRASLYERYCLGAVTKALPEDPPIAPKEALRVVTRMLAARFADESNHDRSFSVEDCVAQTESADPAMARKACSGILGSKLFERVGVSGRFRFDNRSIMDYFVARWADGLATAKGKAGCARVPKLVPLFASPEVASFLVGMNLGRHCLGEVILALCKQGVSTLEMSSILDAGVPPEPQRRTLVRRARRRAGPNVCAGRILDFVAAPQLKTKGK